MSNPITRFLVSSKLFSACVKKALNENADSFKIESESILFLSKDKVVVDMGICGLKPIIPIEGAIDFHIWLRVSNVLSTVSEQPITLAIEETSSDSFNFHLMHMTF